MALEIIGMIGGKPESELKGAVLSWAGAPDVDRDYIRTFARAHEDGGFDRVLIGYGSSGPDGWSIATWAGAVTDRLRFLLAHRPGFVAPTLAARKATTIEHLIGEGRIGLHIITGGSDIEQQRDGDFHDKDVRYRRTGEYLDVLRRTWTSTEPFDYDGEFYQFKGAFSGVKPLEQPHPRLWFGGSSDAALDVGARHADIWASYGEPLESVRAQLAAVRERAATWGRRPGLHVSLRVILGVTEEKAWERAHDILAQVKERAPKRPPSTRTSVGSQRLQDFAARAERYDKRLWTAITAAGGPGGNSTALVGTPDQVAESLADYHDAGAESILIRGFDPLQDAIEYGRDLLPVVRREVARRDAERAAAEAKVAVATAS